MVLPRLLKLSMSLGTRAKIHRTLETKQHSCTEAVAALQTKEQYSSSLAATFTTLWAACSVVTVSARLLERCASNWSAATATVHECCLISRVLAFNGKEHARLWYEDARLAVECAGISSRLPSFYGRPAKADPALIQFQAVATLADSKLVPIPSWSRFQAGADSKRV